MAVDLFNRHFDFPVLLAIREAFESGTWDGWMRAVTALGDHLEFPPKCCYYTFERIFIGSSLGGLMPRSL